MLTVLQQQLGETHGLAIAAAVTVDRVEERLLDHRFRRDLDTMRLDANEARARCLEAERAFEEELATEILAHANTTSERAADLAGVWFKAGTGPLAAWGLLAMGEAAEVAAWSALLALAERDGRLVELARWGLAVQQRHLALALDGAMRLAGSFDPSGPRWG